MRFPTSRHPDRRALDHRTPNRRALGFRVPGRRALGRRAPGLRSPGLRTRPSPACAVLLGLVVAVLMAALPPPSAALRFLPAVRAGEPPPPVALRTGAPGRAPGAPGERAGGPVWPLAGRPAVVRGWEPPAGPYGPGHRGVDLAARAGDTVVAAATGRVAFAGRVAGRGVLVIELAGSGAPPLRTTYEPVRALVAQGDEVVAGRPVGLLEAGPFHCAGGCLHWGLRRGEAYLNPLSLLRRGPSRLLPVSGVPEP
ncbi:murein hydrolase activator EnvC family protein [Streptomyces rhizosphaericola]|uniref:murein hydrolase activator EnvC family protein n=1 Tax=Streptomyces rhizosphaericola TaxID=2564098 RepID=UPI003BF526DA